MEEASRDEIEEASADEIAAFMKELTVKHAALVEKVAEFNKIAAKFDRQLLIGHAMLRVRTLAGKNLTWRRSFEAAVKVVQDEFPALKLSK